MADAPPAALTTSEVARSLGVSPSLIRTWVTYLNIEVRRNAEGHRLFWPDDVAQLEHLKAWLGEGHSLKEYRRERQVEGEFDPRIELRGAFRRLKDLQSQQQALLEKHWELQGAMQAQQAALQADLRAIQQTLGAPESPVETILKQVMATVLEARGRLQRLGRFEEDGRAFLDYQDPASGKRQVVEDACATEGERQLLARVVGLMLEG